MWHPSFNFNRDQNIISRFQSKNDFVECDKKLMMFSQIVNLSLVSFLIMIFHSFNMLSSIFPALGNIFRTIKAAGKDLFAFAFVF